MGRRWLDRRRHRLTVSSCVCRGPSKKPLIVGAQKFPVIRPLETWRALVLGTSYDPYVNGILRRQHETTFLSLRGWGVVLVQCRIGTMVNGEQVD